MSDVHGRLTGRADVCLTTLPLGINRVVLRFGADLAGNLYVTAKQDGLIRRLLPEAGPKVPALAWPLRGGSRIAAGPNGGPC